MEEFDNVIGYDSIKSELKMILDILINEEKYKKLGVGIPRGLLFHGRPGTGKTLMSMAFIKASKRKSYICRKDLPANEFVNYIRNIFNDAKKNAPSIILFDDIDKYENCDFEHKNGDSFITIQAFMDKFKDDDIFVIATANYLSDIPDSLLRSGRFDYRIKLKAPSGKDAEKIVQHYIDNKTYVNKMDTSELAKILQGHSCAELENIINQAGIYAGYHNRKKIEFEDILNSSIKHVYGIGESIEENEDLVNRIAYHEAGHVVVSEILVPCSVSLASISKSQGKSSGFTSHDEKINFNLFNSVEKYICATLGGKAAIENVFSEIDMGDSMDLQEALECTRSLIEQNALLGFDYIDVTTTNKENTIIHIHNQEKAAINLLKSYYQKARNILIENRAFLDDVANELKERKTLLGSDIQKIKSKYVNC